MAVAIVLAVVVTASSALSWAVVPRLVSTRVDEPTSSLTQDRAWTGAGACSITPEYDRTLRRVLVSLDRKDTTLGLLGGLLEHLPRYTEIIVLLSRPNLASVSTELKGKPYRDRIRWVPYDIECPADRRIYLLFRDEDKLIPVDVEDWQGTFGSKWAQDFCEVGVTRSGEPLLLTPVVHRYFSAVGDTSDLEVACDNGYLENLDGVGLRVRSVPIAFKGGNILVDNVEGRSVALCGADILRTTRTASHALVGTRPSDAEIIPVIKTALNVDDVVVVGRGCLQPCLMYHLDQAAVLLAGRVAAVTHVVAQDARALRRNEEVRDVQRFLTELRSVLQALGYRVVDLDTSARNVMRFRYYANAIPYVDLQTRQRIILMPVFPSDQTDFDRELVEKNTTVLESLGYRVVHVPTRADTLKGGIHCLVNVLE